MEVDDVCSAPRPEAKKFRKAISTYNSKEREGEFFWKIDLEGKNVRTVDPNIIVIEDGDDDDDDEEKIELAQTPFVAHNALYHALKYLETNDIINVSKVCSAWNSVAKSNPFWRNIKLNNIVVEDWISFGNIMRERRTVSLDTRLMRIPDYVLFLEFDSFWGQFLSSIEQATNLKKLILCECPPFLIGQLKAEQLEVLEAVLLSNRTIPSSPSDFMSLNLAGLDIMPNLTVINLKGLNEMKLRSFPSFENLPNLRSLSLTSIIAFPRNRYERMKTITTKLEVLEIGDCECLCERFVSVLKRLVNLKRLRLENCLFKWESFAYEAFYAINKLEKLEILELINLGFCETVQQALMMTSCKSILLVPIYPPQPHHTNTAIIECLLKLKKTTRFHWAITSTNMPHGTPDAENTFLLDYLDADYMEHSNVTIPFIGQLIRSPINNKIKLVDNQQRTNFPLITLKALMDTLYEEFKIIYVPSLETVKLHIDTDYSK